MKRTMRVVWPIVILLLLLSAGCASLEPPDSESRRFSDTLTRYPSTAEPLALRRLTGKSATLVQAHSGPADVVVMVHPAYSLFFREAKRSKYPEAKYALLAKQLENEERFISEASKAGEIVVLIIPGNYLSESVAPLSYNAYLNNTTAGGQNVFYVFSESASNGAISVSDMVDLFSFLEGVKMDKVLIGGGYIGRCQREFYSELSAYLDRKSAFIVPELSTISPDDITEAEARLILDSINRDDYTPVRNFIDKKLDRAANLFSLPRKKEL